LRALIARVAITALLILAVAAATAQAQFEFIPIGLGIGYVGLSVGAMSRLMERGRNIVPGDSIRLVAQQQGRPSVYIGTATAISGDSVSIRYGDTTAAFAYTGVSRMYAYSGMESKWAEGWAIGFAGGALIGAVSGFASGGSPPQCEIICPNAEQTGLLVGIFGAVTGSVLGAGIGSLAQGPHWRAVKRNAPSGDTRHAGLSPYLRPHRVGALVHIPIG
jgi:hypothetical protein